jgi:hypothetical protein
MSGRYPKALTSTKPTNNTLNISNRRSNSNQHLAIQYESKGLTSRYNFSHIGFPTDLNAFQLQYAFLVPVERLRAFCAYFIVFCVSFYTCSTT